MDVVLNLPLSFCIFVDVTSYDDFCSIMGFCIKIDRKSSEIKYIDYEQTDFIGASNAELYAIKISLEFISSRIENGITKMSNVTVFCDNKTVIGVINSNKLLMSNLDKNITNKVFTLMLDLQNKVNLNFKWISRDKNRFIDNYVKKIKEEKIKNGSIYGNDKKIIDVLDNENYLKLLSKTLDEIEKSRPDVYRAKYIILIMKDMILKKKIQIQITIKEDENDKIVIGENLKMNLYYVNSKKIEQKHVDYINNVFNTIEKYNFLLLDLRIDDEVDNEVDNEVKQN